MVKDIKVWLRTKLMWYIKKKIEGVLLSTTKKKKNLKHTKPSYRWVCVCAFWNKKEQRKSQNNSRSGIDWFVLSNQFN